MVNTWVNWAGEQRCQPAVTESPGSRDELAEVIRRAGKDGHVVRVAGAGHSFTDAVLTDGTLISLDRLNRVLDIDRSTGLVRVEAGARLHQLNPLLWDNGLAFANLGDIDKQSIAGATSTATHGTGGRRFNISAALHSIELTLADGSTIEVNEADDPEAWHAARVGVGALGVISAVTVRAEPAFVLEGVDRGLPLDEVLADLDAHVDGNDHFEFFSFPHSDIAMTRANNRTEAAPKPKSRAGEWVDQILINNHVFELALRLGRARPSLIPRMNRAISAIGASGHRLDRSYKVFASPRLTKFTEMEYAIPREHAADAVRKVREIAHRYDVSFPLEVRFVAADDAFLSPSSGRATCYLAVHVYRGMPWEPFFREVEAVMDGYMGRPHWGKRHFQTADTLRQRYPDWDRFQAVRARLDPEGRFTNGYVDRVLGPVTAG